jgi:hypothetical protein
MDPVQRRLAILRADATRSYWIGDRATDPKERELFTQFADYLTILAETAECVLSAREPDRDA